MSDGTYKAFVYGEEIHYEKDGAFEEIDNTLVKSESVSGAYYENESNDFAVRLPAKLSLSQGISAFWGSYQVSIRPAGTGRVNGNTDQPSEKNAEELSALKNYLSELNSQGGSDEESLSVAELNERYSEIITENEVQLSPEEIADKIEDESVKISKIYSSVLYPYVYKDVDIEYLLSGKTLKEYITLKSKTSVESFAFYLDSDGLTARVAEDNSVELLDETGSVIFTIPAPYMYDDAGNYSGNISVELCETPTGYKYTLTPDKDWLDSNDTVYPVVIDPTLSTGNIKTVKDTTATYNSGTDSLSNSGENLFMKVGLRYDSVSRTNREVCGLIYTPVPDSISSRTSRIVSASLYLRGRSSYVSGTCKTEMQINALQVKSDWNTGDINENAVIYQNRFPDADFQNIIDSAFVKDTGDFQGKVIHFDITALAQKWLEGYEKNYGIMIKANSLPSSENYVLFYDSTYKSMDVACPCFMFNYRDTQGVEDYWTYTTMSAGRFGTVAVNNFNGNLVIDQPGVGVGGNRLPVNISWMYNTYGAADLGSSYGTGWRTNYDMRVLESGIESQTAAVNNDITYDYYLIDSDGTHHYFFKKDGKYTDEDGLGLTLTVNSSSAKNYTVKDKSDTVYTFTGTKLTKITDSNNNTNVITYNSDGKIVKIMDGAGRAYTISYDANQDATVTDPSGHYAKYMFNNSSGIRQLVNVYYDDGGCVELGYSNDASDKNRHMVKYIDDGMGHRVTVNYRGTSPARVSDISYCSVEGSTVKNTLDKYSFWYENNSTTVWDKMGRSVTYQFNGFGQTCGVINHVTGSGANYEFGMPGGNSNSNKIISASKHSVASANIVTNGSFNSGISGVQLYQSGSGAVKSWEGSKGNLYKGCLEIAVPSTCNGASALWSCNTQGAGKYTFSAYVNTNGATIPEKGAHIGVNVYNGSGLRTSYESGYIVYTGSGEWTRLQVTIEALASDTMFNLFVSLPYGSVGTVYVDDIQFEKGDSAGTYNLLVNSEFHGNMSYWTAEDGLYTANLGMANTQVAGINYSQYFTGRPGMKSRIYQDILISGYAGDTYVYGGWSKGISLACGKTGDGRKGEPLHAVYAVMYDSAGNIVSQDTAEFIPYTGGWQFTSGAIVAKGSYSKIRIYCVYDYNVGRADFAMMFLNKENYGQSYTYDENGNAVSVSDRAKTESTFSYNNDNLSRMISPTGSRYYYSYNPDTNNLTYAVSSNRQMYAFTYDSYGNATTASVGSAVTYSAADRPHYYYYLINCGTGNALARDKNGHVVNKHWDATDNNQKWFIAYGGDHYMLCPIGDNSRAIQYTNGQFDVKTGNGQKNQKFWLTGGSENMYRFINQDASVYLTGNKNEDSDVTTSNDTNAIVLNTQWYIVREKTSVTNDTYLSSSTTYTSNGNYPASLTDMSGAQTAYDYDSQKGTLKTSTDANGIQTKYTYDKMGKTTSVTTDGHSVNYAYAKDQLSTVTVGGTGQKYSFVYDEFGRNTNVYAGDSYRLTANTYDSSTGTLASQLYWNQDYVHYAYDRLDRVTQKYYSNTANTAAPSDVAVYNYLKDGNLAYVKDHAAETVTSYTYDLAGRTVESVQNDLNGKFLAGIRYRYENGKNRLSSYNVTTPYGSAYSNNYYGYVYGNSASGQNPDALYKLYRGGSVILSRDYDALGRMTKYNLPMAGYAANYTYKAGAKTNQSTALLEKYTTNRQNTKYEYDKNGNITAVYEYENGEYVLTERYTYDKLNQLKRADLRDAGTTTKYFYNAGGNILVREVYAYTTEDTPRNIKNTINYDYTDTSWKDLMTSYDGQTITYDGMGNPLNYRDGISFTWKNGRRMESSTVGSIVTTYDYDIDGNRVERNGAGYRRKYTVIDGVTMGEQITFGGKTHSMEYMRDENGDVYGFIYDRSTYFLEKNALGDVKYLLDGSGNVLAKYTYDEWGRKISVTDANGNEITDGTNIAHLNPFRYRSYYYDNETGLYYLNSRYYDPVTCRFVNADGYVSTGTGILGFNMFAYCNNNPVNMIDSYGSDPIPTWARMIIWGTATELDYAKALSVNANAWSGFARTTVDNAIALAKEHQTYAAGAEHHKRGTTNKSNQEKHENGQARKKRDSGGEKGDARRKPNPNKRHDQIEPALGFDERLVSFSIATIGAIVVIYAVANDITGAGVLDDAAIAPILPIIYDNVEKAFS